MRLIAAPGDTVRIHSLFPAHMMLMFLQTSLGNSSVGVMCQPVSASDLFRKRDNSADFGSHGCPWECGLRLLHLRGAETGPNGRGGENVIQVWCLLR